MTTTDGDTHSLTYEPFQHVIGRRIALLRQQHGVTADELARAARRLGLKWHRPTVATIEGGGRGLTAEELLLLPLIFQQAGAKVTFPELVTADMTVGLVALAAADLGRLIAGKAVTHGEPAVGRADDLPEPIRGYLAIHQAALQEAEQKAARRLGVDAFDVAAASFRLWQRSLTEQREAAARATLAPDAARIRREGGNVDAWLRTALPTARRLATQRLLSELRAATADRERELAEVAALVGSLRRRAGLTPHELAERMTAMGNPTSPEQLAAWEAGPPDGRPPSSAELLAIFRAARTDHEESTS